jgi:hypothetical protein
MGMAWRSGTKVHTQLLSCCIPTGQHYIFSNSRANTHPLTLGSHVSSVVKCCHQLEYSQEHWSFISKDRMQSTRMQRKLSLLKAQLYRPHPDSCSEMSTHSAFGGACKVMVVSCYIMLYPSPPRAIWKYLEIISIIIIHLCIYTIHYYTISPTDHYNYSHYLQIWKDHPMISTFCLQGLRYARRCKLQRHSGLHVPQVHPATWKQKEILKHRKV